MKLQRSFVGWLMMVALLWPICAQASFTFYIARLDWYTADFIGWVRVEQDVTGQVLSRGQSRVKLRVIEQVKGDAMEALTLVYTDPSVNRDPQSDIIVLVPAGDQQWWKDDIGKEFFVFLGRISGNEYEANMKHYFLIERGTVLYLPREYRD